MRILWIGLVLVFSGLPHRSHSQVAQQAAENDVLRRRSIKESSRGNSLKKTTGRDWVDFSPDSDYPFTMCPSTIPV